MIAVKITQIVRGQEMIKRLCFHNFRCLENFELPAFGQASALLIGRNGVGKSSIAIGLELLQHIARGTNRVRELVRPRFLTWAD